MWLHLNICSSLAKIYSSKPTSPVISMNLKYSLQDVTRIIKLCDYIMIIKCRKRSVIMFPTTGSLLIYVGGLQLQCLFFSFACYLSQFIVAHLVCIYLRFLCLRSSLCSGVSAVSCILYNSLLAFLHCLTKIISTVYSFSSMLCLTELNSVPRAAMDDSHQIRKCSNLCHLTSFDK